MGTILERIKRDGLWERLSQDERAEYAKYAQEARDDRINAGSARSLDHRLDQGTIKKELYEMADRVR